MPKSEWPYVIFLRGDGGLGRGENGRDVRWLSSAPPVDLPLVPSVDFKGRLNRLGQWISCEV